MANEIYSTMVYKSELILSPSDYTKFISACKMKYTNADLLKFKNECPKIIEQIQTESKKEGLDFINDLNLN